MSIAKAVRMDDGWHSQLPIASTGSRSSSGSALL